MGATYIYIYISVRLRRTPPSAAFFDRFDRQCLTSVFDLVKHGHQCLTSVIRAPAEDLRPPGFPSADHRNSPRSIIFNGV